MMVFFCQNPVNCFLILSQKSSQKLISQKLETDFVSNKSHVILLLFILSYFSFFVLSVNLELPFNFTFSYCCDIEKIIHQSQRKRGCISISIQDSFVFCGVIMSSGHSLRLRLKNLVEKNWQILSQIYYFFNYFSVVWFSLLFFFLFHISCH